MRCSVDHYGTTLTKRTSCDSNRCLKRGESISISIPFAVVPLMIFWFIHVFLDYSEIRLVFAMVFAMPLFSVSQGAHFSKSGSTAIDPFARMDAASIGTSTQCGCLGVSLKSLRKVAPVALIYTWNPQRAFSIQAARVPISNSFSNESASFRARIVTISGKALAMHVTLRRLPSALFLR